MYGTMTRSKRLSPVLKLAESKQRDAVQVMAKARRRLNHYEEKLNELRKFHEEYSNAYRHSQSGVISATQLQETQKFLRQLDEGIAVMSEKVTGQKQLNLRDEQQWLLAKNRTDALDKLITKIQGVERNIRDNREADEVDERSQHQKPKI